MSSVGFSHDVFHDWPGDDAKSAISDRSLTLRHPDPPPPQKKPHTHRFATARVTPRLENQHAVNVAWRTETGYQHGHCS